jgi:hypothetical protein
MAEGTTALSIGPATDAVLLGQSGDGSEVWQVQATTGGVPLVLKAWPAAGMMGGSGANALQVQSNVLGRVLHAHSGGLSETSVPRGIGTPAGLQ